MSSAVYPKAAHYERELQSALCRGAWSDAYPGKTPKGIPVPWGELLRKYVKHGHHSDFAAVARATRDLSLLLFANRLSTSINATSFDFDCTSDEDVLSKPEDYRVEDQRMKEASTLIKSLTDLGGKAAAKPDVMLCEGYILFATRQNEAALGKLSDVPYETQPAPPSIHGSALSAPSSALSSLGTSSGAATLEAALSRSGTLAGSVGVTDIQKRLDVDVGEGKVWAIVERARGRCLQALLFEQKLDFTSALTSYDAGIALFDTLAISRMTPDAKDKATLFAKYREFWRWAERLLRGAAIAAAKSRPKSDALRYLRLYTTYSSHWPAVFRPNCRTVMYTLHMRCLCLVPPGSPSSSTGKQAWRSEARHAAHELKVILDYTTEFPRAGEINHRVLDFVDLCVAVWEKGGNDPAQIPWIVDMLWWSTRLTFHSHRIMRHLSSLLLMQDDAVTAQRTFKLYVQLVTKSRQTAAGDVSLQLKRRPTEDPAASPADISARVSEEEGFSEELLRGSGVDADSDRMFVEHLIWGVAMLAKSAKSFEDAKKVDETATLARSVVDSMQSKKKDDIMGRVLRSQGVASLVLGQHEPDNKLRPKHQLAALEFLKLSARMDPDAASTHFHLAIAQADSRDIPGAIVSARQAVEKCPSEIRAWHLLGLLLTAQGDWSGAHAVFDLGLAHSEDQETEESFMHTNGDVTATIDGLPGSEGLMIRDFALPDESSPTSHTKEDSATPTLATPMILPDRRALSPVEILIPTTLILPPSSSLFPPPPDIPLQTKMDKFEASLQLRLSQLALTEFVDGAEEANARWPAIFSFFSEASPSGLGRHPLSQTNGGRSTVGHSIPGSVRQFHSASQPSESLTVSDRPATGTTSESDAPRIGVLIPPSPGPGDQRFSRSSQGSDSSNRRHHHKDMNGHEDGNFPKRMLNKGQKQMQTLGRKVAKIDGFVDGSMKGLNRRLHRTNSAPDFSTRLTKPYQASSIHSRSRFKVMSLKLKAGSSLDLNEADEDRDAAGRAFSPPPPLPPPTSPSSRRPPRETRMLSDLWLTSAATFRRMGKLEQAKAAIQEAEVADEENPNVWVQLGLYHSANGNDALAIEALHKALVISLDHVPALVHISQVYLKLEPLNPEHVDLAAGLLSGLTKGKGWDVPEAWYFLAKACGWQGRRERERECLVYALALAETRAVRDLGSALPRCL